MTSTYQLGRLERVDLRAVWTREAGDFTPWLAREDNIAALSEAVGIELEVEAQEKDVGPFRADILCKDTATNDWVLIENQLERKMVMRDRDPFADLNRLISSIIDEHQCQNGQ